MANQPDTGDQAARRRLSLLELAESLGNVAEACRRCGLSRTRFYVYRRRYEKEGLDGLKNRPPVPRSRPPATSPEVVERLLALSELNPLRGCWWLSETLKEEGVSLSGPTVQKILTRNGLGRRSERGRRLEEKARGAEEALSAGQVEAIEKANPCFRERKRRVSRPGELLRQSTFLVGTFDGIGKVYAQVVLDTYCSYAFAWLHTERHAVHAVTGLKDNVLPRYRRRTLQITAILTHWGRQYHGASENHPYERCLKDNGTLHYLKQWHLRATDGFVERFRVTLFSTAVPSWKTAGLKSIEELQDRLDAWLREYNERMRFDGYPNYGSPPAKLIEDYLRSVPRP